MTFELSTNPNVDDPLLRNKIQGRIRDSHSRRTIRESVLRIGDIPGHSGHRPYNVLMDFLIFAVTLLEITVVIFLAVTHFKHSQGLTAMAMLLPLLLNCVGVLYFLSDMRERNELESVGCSRCLTDFLQVPVLGPVFTAFKVMSISCGCTSHANYERIEASAIKLRQAGGFFTAAPEALVQCTALLTMNHWGRQMATEGQAPTQEHHDAMEETWTRRFRPLIFSKWLGYLESGAVILFIFTLAESNCYNVLSSYYKMFTTKRVHEDSWRLGEVLLWQKFLLFVHSMSSIGCNMLASAGFKAAALYYWKTTSFPLVLVLIVFFEISVRLIVYYVARVLKFFWLERTIPSSCYESLSYAWRSTILNYGFQSTNIFVQVMFYLQNIIGFVVWVIAARMYGDAWVRGEIFVPFCVVFAISGGISIVSLLVCSFFELIRLHGGPVAED